LQDLHWETKLQFERSVYCYILIRKKSLNASTPIAIFGILLEKASDANGSSQKKKKRKGSGEYYTTINLPSGPRPTTTV